jgi:hypothetical protein
VPSARSRLIALVDSAGGCRHSLTSDRTLLRAALQLGRALGSGPVASSSRNASWTDPAQRAITM